MNFVIVDENPNEVTGGCGCLCNEGGCADTKGPFVVFYASEMESSVSPTPVLCQGCVIEAMKQLSPGERGGGGATPKPAPKRKDITPDI